MERAVQTNTETAIRDDRRFPTLGTTKLFYASETVAKSKVYAKSYNTDMKLLSSVGLLLIAAVAWAQSNPLPFQPLAQLKDFLQLSDAQLQSILSNNDDF